MFSPPRPTGKGLTELLEALDREEAEEKAALASRSVSVGTGIIRVPRGHETKSVPATTTPVPTVAITPSKRDTKAGTPPGGPLEVPSHQLYFRFWAEPGKVHEYACPIRKTPHYRFAFSYVKGAPGVLPQNTGYGRYARWEAQCIKGGDHSEVTFAANILAWSKEFDIEQHPLKVCEMRNFPGRYFITDGAHRAALAVALHDLGKLQADKISAVLVENPGGWPEVAQLLTEDISQVVPQYLRF